MSPFLLTKLVDKRFKVFDEDDAGKDEGVRGVGDYEVPVERRPPIHQLASKKRWMLDEMEEIWKTFKERKKDYGVVVTQVQEIGTDLCHRA